MTPFGPSVITSQLIEECPLNIECEVVHKIAYPGSHKWFVGEIKAVHVEKEYDAEYALMFWGKHYRRVGGLLEPA